MHSLEKIIYQRTLKSPVKINGVGLHSGANCQIEILPDEANSGINFIRLDICPNERIKACYNNVQNTMLATSIVKNGIEIKTIEHLMAALSGLKIDNALIKVYGSEIPILDGSSKIFIDEILKVGILEQADKKKFLKVKKNIEVRYDDSFATLKPYNGSIFNFMISYNNVVVQNTPNVAEFDLINESFEDLISVARTFGFENDINYLKKENLIMGGSLDNAIVVGETSILNNNGLRMKDEFVKHKILDAIGDVYLSGYQILGFYQGYKSGHGLNNKLIRKLMLDDGNFEIISF